MQNEEVKVVESAEEVPEDQTESKLGRVLVGAKTVAGKLVYPVIGGIMGGLTVLAGAVAVDVIASNIDDETETVEDDAQ